MDRSPTGSSVHGISQPRILEQVAIPSSGNLPRSGFESMFLSLADGFFTIEPPATSGESRKVKVKVTQLGLTLFGPMDYAVHGILQARTLERVAFPSSRGSSQPRDRTQGFCIAGGFFTS